MIQSQLVGWKTPSWRHFQEHHLSVKVIAALEFIILRCWLLTHPVHYWCPSFHGHTLKNCQHRQPNVVKRCDSWNIASFMTITLGAGERIFTFIGPVPLLQTYWLIMPDIMICNNYCLISLSRFLSWIERPSFCSSLAQTVCPSWETLTHTHRP